MTSSLRMIRVVDSHTAGQPTRVIVDGSPDLGEGTLVERRDRFRRDFDRFRSAVVGEPRGYDALVGAILCKPSDPTCTTAAIFFDSFGYHDMSGHGMIGLAVTLEYLGHISRGPVRVETPAGPVTIDLHEAGDISVQNVPSFRHRKGVVVSVDGAGKFGGDIAWGGAWYFLADDHREELNATRLDRLTEVTRSIRRALAREGITGPKGETIDNVALFGQPHRRDARSKNFVLRAGRTYGRSPSGTAMSAKMACLYTDGLLPEGQNWRQESILGTIFDGSVSVENGQIIPTIRSTAHVTAESTLIVDERDPYTWGLA
jgi:4-hydroxyproline epimerase